MAKTITITVTDTESTEVEQIQLTYDGEPTEEQWDEILRFEDDHVGGRPKDR